jgi:hypothetical protein
MAFGIPTLRVVTETTTRIRHAGESKAPRIIIHDGDLTNYPSLLSSPITLVQAYHVDADMTVYDYTFIPAAVYTVGGTIYAQTPTGEVVSLSERDEWDDVDVSQYSLAANL